MIEQEILKILEQHPLIGVRYNVIRRPLSGKGPTRQLENVNRGKQGPNGEKLAPREETLEELCERVALEIKAAPQEWFMRWQVLVSQADVARFRRECLDPILE